MPDRPAATDLDATPEPARWCCAGNAEDCPLCDTAALPYPWICPGHHDTPNNRARSNASATPTCQTIELQLTGYPDTPYRWGGGLIRPSHVAITTLNGHRSAHLYGTWINENGEPTRQPADQLYRHDDDWPTWLTALADKHKPTRMAARPDSRTEDRYADPRADSFDGLRSQRATAQKQVDTWTARVHELSRIIRQHEEQHDCKEPGL